MNLLGNSGSGQVYFREKSFSLLGDCKNVNCKKKGILIMSLENKIKSLTNENSELTDKVRKLTVGGENLVRDVGVKDKLIENIRSGNLKRTLGFEQEISKVRFLGSMES
jgi:hypothetical protein